MQLDEARLKPYTVTREGQTTTAPSGISTAAVPTTFEVAMDIQPDSTPRFAAYDGEERFVGGYVGFTYLADLQVGDRIYETPFGALRVEGVYPWDDLDVTHFEVNMVPA